MLKISFLGQKCDVDTHVVELVKDFKIHHYHFWIGGLGSILCPNLIVQINKYKQIKTCRMLWQPAATLF
jgi:hypothetical protein